MLKRQRLIRSLTIGTVVGVFAGALSLTTTPNEAQAIEGEWWLTANWPTIQPIANPEFATNLSGWSVSGGTASRLNTETGRLQVESTNANAFEVKTSTAPVKQLPAGAVFQVVSKLVSTKATNGHLYLDEVVGNQTVKTHTYDFTLAAGKWTSPSRAFTTVTPNAELKVRLKTDGQQANNVKVENLKLNAIYAAGDPRVSTNWIKDWAWHAANAQYFSEGWHPNVALMTLFNDAAWQGHTQSTAPQPPTTPPPVDTCKAPDYTKASQHGKTYFGSSLSNSGGLNLSQSLANNDAAFGKMPVVRQFDPTVPPDNAWSRRTFLNDRMVVHSFREHPDEILAGTHDAAILDFYSKAPTSKPIFYSYFHEPEAVTENVDPASPAYFTKAEFRAAFQHVVNLVGTLCKGNLYPTVILTGHTAMPSSNRNWLDWYPGDQHVSVVGWDPYNSATGSATTYKTPESIFGPVITATKQVNKPWGIAETGTNVIAGDTNATARAAWLTSIGNYLDTQDAAFVAYFNSTRDGNFVLTDTASKNAWKTLVARYAN